MATKRSVGTLSEADLKGKKVFLRADLNVPLDDNQKITDDTRIRASVPTIKFLMEKGAKVILASHLGRPKGVTPKYSLKPLVPRLSELLGVDVVMANDCIGEEVEKLAAALPDGGVLLLENVRFHKEEEKNDPEFAKKLASVADLYVNDAFGSAHRAHASTEGVTKYLKPAVAGFLMQKELDYLVGAVANPKKPFAAIVGGSKVSTKIGVIESLLAKVDILILGGGMIFTFYKAQGHAVGKSLVEEDKLELATSLIEKAKSKGVSLLLPTDVVVADKFAADAESKELDYLVGAVANPKKPFGDTVGGFKVSKKIRVTESLVLENFDPATPQYLKWSEHIITFSQEDHPMHIPYPGRFPLVLNPTVGGVILTKTLIDGGSGLNILFVKTIEAMGISRCKLSLSDSPFYGIDPEKSIMPIGRIELPVTFGEINNFRTEVLTFEVADIEMAYHAIIGRPGICKFMAVPHYTYMMMKIPGPNGIITVKCDMDNVYACDKESVKLAIKYESAAEKNVVQLVAASEPNSGEEPSKATKTSIAASPQKTKMMTLNPADSAK